MSSSSQLSQSMQTALTICISYVPFFGALSEYPGSCYHLYLLCPLLRGSLRVSRQLLPFVSLMSHSSGLSQRSRQLLPFVSLMSHSSGLSQSIQAAVTICISYVPFFRALSKYPGNCYYLYLLCPLLQGSLKVCRLLWGKGSCYPLYPNTQDSKTNKKKAQNHSQQPGTSTTYHQSLRGPEHQWECFSTALCASVWRSQTPSSAESATTQKGHAFVNRLIKDQRKT